MYAELNRFLVGSGQIPLNTELKQDNRTVCCSHTVVQTMQTTKNSYTKIFSTSF